MDQSLGAVAQHHPHSRLGVIAAGDPQTAEAGMAVLRQGGNAVDAAVAAAFASFVAEMMLVNIGGGGVAMVHMAKTNRNVVYDFFSDMPRQLFNAAQADFQPVEIDFGVTRQSFYIGRASVAVPGVVAGLGHMARQHGRLPWSVLLQPAVQLAREGAIVSAQMAEIARLLSPILSHTAEAKALFMPQGQPLRTGERLRSEALTQTLTTLGQQGVDYFYRGELARQILADQQRSGGLLTEADLSGYQVRLAEPISLDYRGYTVQLPPSSSVGGVLIAFSLKLLTALDPKPWAPLSTAHVRALIEVMRLTNVARGSLTLDEGGISYFLSEANVERYRHELSQILAGAAPPAEPAAWQGPNDTTHISVIDGEGNMVSLTTSAGEGAGFVVGDSGVVLNNMLGEIDLHPHGFHQAPGGLRLQTMMSPTLILKDSRPVLTVGSGGSSRLRSAILQVLTNVIDFEMPLEAAVHAPRVHLEEGVVQLEGGISPDVGDELAALGYRVNRWPGLSLYFGGAHSAGIVQGEFVAVGDRRRGGVGLSSESTEN